MRIGWYVFFSSLGITVACGVSTTGEPLPVTPGTDASSASSTSSSSSSTSSGSSGTDAGDADTKCPADQVAPGGAGCPTECTGGCPRPNVCRIECTDQKKCSSVTCAPGFACEVSCVGEDACEAATIVCAPLYACSLTCKAKDGCADARFICGGGSCTVDCAGEACKGTKLECGVGSCSATCGSGATKPVVVGAGASCDAKGC